VFTILQQIKDMKFSTVPHILVSFMIMLIRVKNFFKVIAIKLQQLHALKIRDGSLLLIAVKIPC